MGDLWRVARLIEWKMITPIWLESVTNGKTSSGVTHRRQKRHCPTAPFVSLTNITGCWFLEIKDGSVTTIFLKYFLRCPLAISGKSLFVKAWKHLHPLPLFLWNFSLQSKTSWSSDNCNELSNFFNLFFIIRTICEVFVFIFRMLVCGLNVLEELVFHLLFKYYGALGD